MKIIDKFTSIKDTLIESYAEYNIIKDMSASEIANRYGYSKFLAYVRKKLWESKSEPIEIVDKDQEESLDENLEDEPILIKFSRVRDDDNKIIIHEEGFGEKEEYDINIIKFMLKKYNADTSIGQINGEEHLCIKMIPEKKDFGGLLEEFYENRSAYIDYVKGITNQAKTAAKNATKKTLNKMAAWANENL